jgi:peptidoglycan hydrolase-like protein with peptidoglycan-binding domain
MDKHSLTKTAWLRGSLLAVAISAFSVQMAIADDQVALVQETLKLKHFYYGEVDGNFDCATQSALRRFQFRNGIPGTGEMDPVTLQSLAGKPSTPTAPGGIIFAQTVRDRDLGSQNQNTDNYPEANAKADESRKVSPVIHATREQRNDMHGGYAEQFPSWSAQHRAFFDDGVEVRRAIPIAPKMSDEENGIPRAIPVSPLDSIGEASSREVVTTEVGHFSGQDGHVYTYTRKVRTLAPDTSDASNATASRFATTGGSPAPGYGATAASNVAVSTWPPVLIWTQTR